MPKRKVKKPKRRVKKIVKMEDLAAKLGKSLAKRTKGDLIDALLELVKGDRNTLRRLYTRFKLEAPPEELVHTTRQAITDATDFDERDINCNFSYDYAAYGEVNFQQAEALSGPSQRTRCC